MGLFYTAPEPTRGGNAVGWVEKVLGLRVQAHPSYGQFLQIFFSLQ